MKNAYYEPSRYLGVNVGKFDLPDGSDTMWVISKYDCVKEVVNAVSTDLTGSGGKFNGKADSVMRTGYRHELEVQPFF